MLTKLLQGRSQAQMFDFNSVLIGQYRPLDTPIHRLDPRIKIIWTVVVMALVAFTLHPVLYAALTVYFALLTLLARISPTRLMTVIKTFLLLFGVTFVLHILFSEPVGRIYVRIGGIAISSHGLQNGLLYSYRIFLFLMAASLVNLTTSPIDMTDGLLRLIKPLRKLHVPVGEISMMVFVALRFVPILSEEVRAIRAAQLSRALRPARGPIGRIRSTVPLILPLFAGAVRRADHLAIAIESRGYRRGVGRTSFTEFRLQTADGVFALIFVVLILCTLIVKYGID